MPHTEAPALTAPALFDVTTVEPADPAGALVRIALDEIELAPNARREIAQEAIERLAPMLMTMGQLVPRIRHPPARQPLRLYPRPRRFLAPPPSPELPPEGPEPGRR